MLVSNLHAGGKKMMDKRKLGGVSVILSVFVVSVLVMGAVPIGALADDEGTRADEVLKVGAQDDTKTRNPYGANDVWTSNVLAPVYSGVGKEDPATWLPIPYLLKGIADSDKMSREEKLISAIIGLGYLSHLSIDSQTIKGIPLL